jgi:hypothetical protein
MLYIEIACRWLLVLVFAYSAVSKLHSGAAFRRFRTWLAGLPLPVARRPGAAAVTVAAAEVCVVVLAALPWTRVAGLALAAAIMAVFITGTALAIARGTTATCECFGTSGTRLGRQHLARDGGLLAAAVLGAAAPGAHGAAAGAAVSVAAAVVIAILVVFLDDWLALFAAGPGPAAGARP